MALVCAVLLLLCAATAVHGDLLLTYSINRHGARNALPKSSTLKESDSIGGVTLLPQGERLCYNAGAAFRQRYLADATCSLNNTCLSGGGDTTYGYINGGHGFNNFNTWVRSSYTDRALLSAQSWLGGVFPAQAPDAAGKLGTPTGTQEVPVYTVYGKDEDDWLVRAYTKCPVYDNNLGTWYKSDEFKAKEAETAALRDQVRQVATPGLDTSLTNWWNVYDGWNVWRSYGVGTPMPNITNDLFNQIKVLANWLEISKARSSVGAGLTGAPLVADMVTYMYAALSARAQNTVAYYRMLAISSHYNVQLAAMAAISLDTYAPARAAIPWLSPSGTLPALAAQAVWELHGPPGSGAEASGGGSGSAPVGLSDTTVAVRLVTQDGPTAPWVTVPLPCESPDGAAIAGSGACTLAAFKQLAATATSQGGSAESWCKACANTNALSCMLVDATAGGQSTGSSGGSDDIRPWRIGVGVGVSLSFVVGALLGAAILHLMSRRNKYRGTEGPSMVMVNK